MQGTIRRNNVLEPMTGYLCNIKLHVSPIDTVYHSSGKASWPMRMSTECRYDMRQKDERCEGCVRPWDREYVESLC